MKRSELIKMLTKCGVEPNEAAAEVNLAIKFVLNKSLEDLILEPDFDCEKIFPLIKKRAEAKCPIQYILGFAPFMGEKFKVNENVLIPRDETEILVQQTIKCAGNIKNNRGRLKILDIGTGSGIIACMTGKKLGNSAEILGIDISTEALSVAVSNMEGMNLTGRVMFRKSNIFSNIKNEKFDIIVSNPPYIPKSYMENIQREVKFEPEIALFTEDADGLYFYRKISTDAPAYLNKGGYLLFEVMRGQAKQVKKIMSDSGFKDIKITKDLAGIERVVEGKLACFSEVNIV